MRRDRAAGVAGVRRDPAPGETLTAIRSSVYRVVEDAYRLARAGELEAALVTIGDGLEVAGLLLLTLQHTLSREEGTEIVALLEQLARVLQDDEL